MRDFRSLPPFLRVIAIVALLFSLASIVTFVAVFVLSIMGGDVVRQELANDHRAFAIAVNLSLLSLACGFAVNRYRTRVRQPNQERLPLDSWQRQARAIALLAALPVCAIVLAAILPPTQDAAVVTIAIISITGAVVLTTAYVLLLARG